MESQVKKRLQLAYEAEAKEKGINVDQVWNLALSPRKVCLVVLLLSSSSSFMHIC